MLGQTHTPYGFSVDLCVCLEIDCAPLTISINQNLSTTETPGSVWTEAEKLSLFLIMQDRMETPTQEVVYVIGLAFLKMCSTSFKLTVASGAHLPVLLPPDKMTVGI